MRRLICLLLAAALLLCACGGKTEKEKEQSIDSATYDKLLAAVEGFNGEGRRQTSVILSLTAGDESRYFTQGSFAYSRVAPVEMSGRSTEVYGGEGTSSDVYYKAGAYYYSGKEGKFYESFDRDRFLNQYLCTNISLCPQSSVTSLSTANTSVGTKYVLSAIDAQIFDTLFLEIQFLYCGAKKLQADKTEYKNGTFTCVLDENGALSSFCISCDAVVYDTPAYYPTGYTPEEDELKKSCTLSYEVYVKALGDGVIIEEPNTKDFVFLG